MIIEYPECETVEFLSRSPYFERERDGMKNVTVRIFKNADEENLFRSCMFTLHKIRIRRADGDGECFERIITDITTLPNVFPTVYIISWEGR